MKIGDVSVVDGNWHADRPAVILEAETARRAIEAGELDELVDTGLRALDLTGKAVVLIYTSEDDAA